MIKKLLALLKREILEHKNIWRVPVILIGIAILLRVSLLFGNLSIDFNVPSELKLDGAIDSVMGGVLAKALSSMNFIIILAMFLVAIFYALSCLYDERQDQSILFWRSLPISDSLTIVSKLLIALIVIPIALLVCQIIVAIVFLGSSSGHYLYEFYSQTLGGLVKFVLWSMLPTVAWCLLCSEISKKNPFLLAFIGPIIFVLVDNLFLNGIVSDVLVINRLTELNSYKFMSLLWGGLFSVCCITIAIVKRSQRI